MKESIFFLALCFFAAIIYKTIIFKTIIKKKSKAPRLPPGPLGYPIIGCIPEMLKNRPTFRWIHQLMLDLNTEIACVRLGSIHVIAVTSPELAREFLKTHDSTFSSRPNCMLAKLVSNGYKTAILTPMGNQWKKMRRILASEVLSVNAHNWLNGKRDEEADHLIRYIYNQIKSPVKKGVVNVRLAAQHYCGNLIRKMVFNKRFFGTGMEDGGPGAEEIEHVAGLFKILSYLYGFAIADYAPWLEIFDIDGNKKILKKALKSVTKYQDPEIMKRVEMWRNGERKVEEDILDVLINLKDSNLKPLLTIEEIKAQIVEIMIATIDNPSNAVEWAMAELLRNPDALTMATKELDKVVGKNRLVEETDLSSLPYLKACAREAFRLHPIEPFNVPHVSTQDAVVNGYFIPKGSHVLLSRPGLGRNPRVWEDPLSYKPERHIVSNSKDVVLADNELRMLSFSTGRRGCAGVLLGSTMTMVLLARLLQGFTWTEHEDHPIDLRESYGDLFMVKPLMAHAAPRLNEDVYRSLYE